MKNTFNRRTTGCAIARLASSAFAVVALSTLVVAQKTVAQQAPSTWPAAPVSDPHLLEPYVPGGKPRLQIKEPIGEALPYDFLKEVASAGQFRGTLIYPSRYGEAHFVLRSIGVTRKIGQQSTSVATYPMESAAVFDPQFSSNGSQILFKIGDPFESTGSFNLFLWDTVAARLREALKERISFNNIAWSPNNNYVAYVRGGDVAGRVRRGMLPLRLRVLDLQTGKSRHVAKNIGVTDMVWTQQGTLLFSMLPHHPQDREENEPKDPNEDTDAATEPDAPAQTSIYEVSLEQSKGKSKKPQLLITNGHNPAPSANGKWIAFLAPPPVVKDAKGVLNADPSKHVLHLYDRSQKQRIVAGMQNVSSLRWTPDSRFLAALQEGYRENEDGTATGTAYISLINPNTLEVKPLATLQAQEYRPISRINLTAPQFNPIKFSNDGRHLFVRVSEVTGVAKGGGFNTTRKMLQAVSLSDGSVTTLARFEDPGARVLGFDWHDESGSTGSTSSLRLRRRSK